MSQDQTQPSAVQCWAAEYLAQRGHGPFEDLTQIEVITNIDPDASDYGYGGEVHPAPRSEILIRHQPTETWSSMDIDSDFDLEYFVAGCIEALERHTTKTKESHV